MESVLVFSLQVMFALVSLGAAWSASIAATRAQMQARRVAALEAELAALDDAVTVLRKSQKRVEGRQTKELALVPRASYDADAEPDSKLDPEGWKQWQNRRLTATRSSTQ